MDHDPMFGIGMILSIISFVNLGRHGHAVKYDGVVVGWTRRPSTLKNDPNQDSTVYHVLIRYHSLLCSAKYQYPIIKAVQKGDFYLQGMSNLH